MENIIIKISTRDVQADLPPALLKKKLEEKKQRDEKQTASSYAWRCFTEAEEVYKYLKKYFDLKTMAGVKPILINDYYNDHQFTIKKVSWPEKYRVHIELEHTTLVWDESSNNMGPERYYFRAGNDGNMHYKYDAIP